MSIEDDVARSLAIPKWQVLEALRIPPKGGQFFTLKEARNAYYLTKHGTEAERAALLAWNAFVHKAIITETTVPGITDIHRKAPLKDTRDAALAKWVELSLAKVEVATTETEIKEAFHTAPEGPVKYEAIRKLVALYEAQ